jgi:mannosyltransferase
MAVDGGAMTVPAAVSETAPRRPGTRTAELIVVGLTLAGLLLRLAGIDESLYGDELFTHEVSMRPALPDVIEGVRSNLELNPPLFYVLAWAAAKVGDPQEWLRAPSLVAGVLTIPLTYVLGLRAAGRGPALVAATLMALSPFAIFYSTEARAYGLLGFLSVASTLLLLRAVRSAGVRWWLLYGAAGCAAVYTHYTAVYVLLAQLAWTAWLRRERLPAHLVTLAGVAVAYVPWIPSFAEDTEGTPLLAGPGIGSVTPSVVAKALARWGAGDPIVSLGNLPGPVGLALFAAAALVCVVGVHALVRRGRWRLRAGADISPELRLVAMLGLVLPVGALLYSIVGTNIFVSRNLTASLPALYVLVAAFLLALPRRLATAATALVVAAFGLGALQTLLAGNARPPYRDVAEQIDLRAGPGEPVMLEPLSGQLPLAFTTAGISINLERPHRIFETLVPQRKDRAVRAARGRGLVAVTRGLYPDTGPLDRDTLDHLGLRLAAIRRFPGIDPLTVYDYEVRP